MLGAQQAEGVVLLRGEIVPQEKLVFEHAQTVVGSPEIQVTLLLGRIKAARRSAGRGSRHASKFTWLNNGWPDKDLSPAALPCRQSAYVQLQRTLGGI